MQNKMIRFLSSIGMRDIERFDLDFVSVGRDPVERDVVNMVIQKDLPWEYPLLQEFIEGLGNAQYPYSLRFQYLNAPSADDISGLFFNWYYSHYYDTPKVGMEAQGEKALLILYKDEEERDSLSPRLSSFKELLFVFSIQVFGDTYECGTEAVPFFVGLSPVFLLFYTHKIANS